MLGRFTSPHLQVALDPYNCISRHLLEAKERVVEDFLAAFEDRFVLAQRKDVRECGAEIDTPEFGTGVFSQEVSLDFLSTRRPDLPIILELLPLEHAPEARERAREPAHAELPSS
jgi:hypothetical protein